MPNDNNTNAPSSPVDPRQEWQKEMDYDALMMGAQDFAIKHGNYNLHIWERVNDEKRVALFLKSVICLGQQRKFMMDILNSIPPESVTGAPMAKWIVMQLNMINDLIREAPDPHENIRRTPDAA